MKKEYDFSKAERGKFFRRGAELKLPIYLESGSQRLLKKIADRNGLGMTELVNRFIRKDLELFEKLT